MSNHRKHTNEVKRGKEFDFEKYVFMPHNSSSTFVALVNNRRNLVPRWNVIEQSLSQLKEQILDENSGSIFHLLPNAIRNYNPNLICNFNILKRYLHSQSTDFSNYKTTDIILSIIEGALKMPDLFQRHVKLLRSGSNDVISVNKEQAHCLLCNAFFCTFPKREKHHTEYKSFPKINFTNLFDDTSTQRTHRRAGLNYTKLNKLKCLMNYFAQMMGNYFSDKTEIVFERRTLALGENFNWSNSKTQFGEINVFNTGCIEEAVGKLQVDFANKFVGGGILGNGSVQEEIRFATCPELIVAQLFTECLAERDVLLVHEFQQYSTFSGYAHSFTFEGDCTESGNVKHHLVAMDAYRFQKHDQKQFRDYMVQRELDKCLCAFQKPENDSLPSFNVIASGKWGCGAFNGHPLLKCLIQWMAASVCNVSLDLYTFQDKKLGNELKELKILFRTRKITIGQIYRMILTYGQHIGNSSMPNLKEFFQRSIQNRSHSPTVDLPRRTARYKSEADVQKHGDRQPGESVMDYCDSDVHYESDSESGQGLKRECVTTDSFLKETEPHETFSDSETMIID